MRVFPFTTAIAFTAIATSFLTLQVLGDQTHCQLPIDASLSIVSPRHGGKVFKNLQVVELTVLGADHECLRSKVKKVCLTLLCHETQESARGCYGASDPNAWLQTVELKVRSKFSFSAVAFDVDEQQIAMAVSDFEYTVSDTCKASLTKRDELAMYLWGADGSEGQSKVWNAYNSVGEPYRRLDNHPVCYDEWKFAASSDKDFLSTASAFRGQFGVDCSVQEFGHGDTMFLNFVLVRHPEILRVVELGTFAGITSLYLGMSMSLRSKHGKLDTFDIADWRPERVKASWLDNMNFHIGDCNTHDADGEIATLTRKADLLFVDADSKTRLEQAMFFGQFLRLGGIILVHDFEAGMQDTFERELGKIGFTHEYKALAGELTTSIGLFIRQSIISGP